MSRFFNTLLMITLANNMSVHSFTPSNTMTSSRSHHQIQTLLSDTAAMPYFLDVVGETPTNEQVEQRMASTPKTNTNKPVKKNNSHQEGLFAPVVYLAKEVVGEEELNRIRGNAISMHSDTIKNFVSTADSAFGSRVLETLYKLADGNRNGKLEMEELEKALKTLGFHFLGDKQIKGIFKRAGGEEKGFLTLEEWMAEAPKTLKTNLVKLAKTNGGELGFLV